MNPWSQKPEQSFAEISGILDLRPLVAGVHTHEAAGHEPMMGQRRNAALGNTLRASETSLVEAKLRVEAAKSQWPDSRLGQTLHPEFEVRTEPELGANPNVKTQIPDWGIKFRSQSQRAEGGRRRGSSSSRRSWRSSRAGSRW